MIFLIVLQSICVLGMIILAIVHWEKPSISKKEQEHLDTKQILKKVGIIPDKPFDDEKEFVPIQPKEAAQKILSFLGKPDIIAGDIISHVPRLNPKTEGWEAISEVVSTANIMTYRPQGAVQMKLYELNADYIIWDTGRSVYLMQACNLSPREAKELENQRQAAIDRNDDTVEEFRGFEWTIVGAFGTNTTQKPHERDCSFIEVTSYAKDSQDNKVSVLDSGLLDGLEHDYFDMQAVNNDKDCPENLQVMLAYYSHGSWYCYLGRKLKDQEIDQLTVGA